MTYWPLYQQARRLNFLDMVDTTGSIKFTHEKMEGNSIPFLDVNIRVNLDGTVSTRVYRKKTHTNQYLSFASHHPASHKLGVVRTLLERAYLVVDEEEELKGEKNNIFQALRACHYPEWSFKKVEEQIAQKRDNTQNRRKERKEKTESSRGQVTIPYIRGLSEKIMTIFRKHRVSTTFRPQTTLRKLLVHPKDKVDAWKKCGVVYQVNCDMCDKVYVGETGRKLEKRIEEHRKDLEKNSRPGTTTRATRLASLSEEFNSAITDHMLHNNHTPNWKTTKVLAREDNRLDRTVREAIHIRTRRTFNRDEGAYSLSHIYDGILLQTPISVPPHPRRGGQGHS